MMAGLPDIVGVWHGQFIGIETKMPDGHNPTPIQLLRHQQIRASGGLVLVARTVREVVDWVDGISVPQPTPKTSVRASEPA